MTKPKTLDHFADARVAIERRRASTVAALETAVAAVATHQTALAVLDADLVAIAELEHAAVEIAGRYSKVSAAPRKKAAAADPKRPYGPPYTPEEDERIEGVARGQLKRLAIDLGRHYEKVQKRHAFLINQKKRRTPADPAAVPELPDRIDTEAARAVKRAGASQCYTPEEEAKILAARRGELKQLAEQMTGRTYSGVSKKHEELLRKRDKEASDPALYEPAVVAEPPPPWEDYWITGAETEAAEVLDPQPDIQPEPRLPPIRAQRGPVPRHPPVQPERVDPAHVGRTVTGRNLDNGPEDRRVYNNPGSYTWQVRE